MEKKMTRSELLEIRKKKDLAKMGRDILKKKLDVTVMRLKENVKDAIPIRKTFNEQYASARKAMALAIAHDGVPLIKIISMSSPSEVDVDFRLSNVFGLSVPEVKLLKSSPPKYPLTTSLRVYKAKTQYERLIEIGLDLMNLEVSVKRLLGEVESVRRKVNSLDKKIIPKLEQEIKQLTNTFNEREREEFAKIKFFKN